MIVEVDERFSEEAARYSFRHACDHCCHFDGSRCGDDWPTEQHRLPLVDGAVVFCKEFELA